jgi:hypothetical protein
MAFPYCYVVCVQDAVDRGWLRHGSCSLLAPINLPKVRGGASTLFQSECPPSYVFELHCSFGNSLLWLAAEEHALACIGLFATPGVEVAAVKKRSAFISHCDDKCCALFSSQVIKLALDITSGLAYLHMCGVVHADLSANNILLCRVKPSADSSTALNGKVSGTSGGINSKSAGAVLKAQGIVAPRQTSQNSHEMSAGSGVTSTLQGCGPNLTAAAAACAMPSINSINTTVAVTPPATRFMIAPAVPRVADEMEFTAKVCHQGLCFCSMDKMCWAGCTELAGKGYLDRCAQQQTVLVACNTNLRLHAQAVHSVTYGALLA